MASGKGSVSSNSGGGPSSSSAGNFAGTMALAVVALGLTASIYIANWRHARRGADGISGKGDAAGATTPDGAADGVGSSGGGVAGGAGGVGGAASTAAGTAHSPSSSRGLPQRNYYSIRAEKHIRRHNANLVEWSDESLGVVIPFSPILFAVTREERQAPMVLLTFRYLRQLSHEIAIAIEELCEPQPAERYREASLEKIVDCSRILSTSPIRIGNTNHPSAEYCYVDEQDQMHYVMAVFVTHERLALTIQYSANTRVRNLLPTAFYELVRSIRYPQVRPTSSYLLVSEPRLGLGFRLALDFIVHEGLAESMEGASAYANGNHNSNRMGSVPRTSTDASTAVMLAEPAANASLAGSHTGAALSSPFATAVGRGTRRMGLIACYEPSASAALGSSTGTGPSFTVTNRGGSGGTSGGVNSAHDGGGLGGAGGLGLWNQFLERQMLLAIRRLGVYVGDGPVRVVFREANVGGAGAANGKQQTSDEPVQPGQVVMRPYRLNLSRRGNFGGTEEDDDGDDASRASVSVTGSCCLQEVRLDVNSPCLQLIRDSLDQLALENNDRDSANRSAVTRPELGTYTSPAYLGIFYVPIRDECVSFTFIASAQRHSFEEFVSWCSATMQSVTLGNHIGQGTSLLYCNLRHEILPFTLSLQPGTQVVEEPQLGDPLAVVSAFGVERTTVLVRAFPLLQVLPTSSSGTGTPAATTGGQAPRLPSTPTVAGVTPSGGGGGGGSGVGVNPLAREQRERQRQRTQARVLEHMLRSYLSQLPEAVRVLNWERCTVHGMAAMRFCFEQLAPQFCSVSGGAGGGSSGSIHGNLDELDGCSVATTEWLSSRSLVLEEEVGTMNPFSRYYPPPPPSLTYLGLRPPPAAAAAPPSPTAATRTSKKGVNAYPSPANGRNVNSNAPMANAAMGSGGGFNNQSSTASPSNASTGGYGQGGHMGGGKPPALLPPSTGGSGEGQQHPQHGLVVGGGAGLSTGGEFHGNVSVDSLPADDSVDDPLRVGMVVCADGHAFMFLSSASIYSLSVSQHVVEELASHFALNAAAAL